jgi:hypothetical protein
LSLQGKAHAVSATDDEYLHKGKTELLLLSNRRADQQAKPTNKLCCVPASLLLLLLLPLGHMCCAAAAIPEPHAACGCRSGLLYATL